MNIDYQEIKTEKELPKPGDIFVVNKVFYLMTEEHKSVYDGFRNNCVTLKDGMPCKLGRKHSFTILPDAVLVNAKASSKKE